MTARSDTAKLTGSGGYFEDFGVGQRMRHWRGATVSDVENNLLTKMAVNTADAHWNDDKLPAGHPLGQGRVVFGLITASIVFGLASQDTAEHADKELGCTELRFRAPVHVGDTVYSYTEVLEVAELDATTGRVTFKHWGVNQHDTVVFEGRRDVAIRRRPAQS